jgi:hypothetical protein
VTPEVRSERSLGIVSHTERLNQFALAITDDVNEARLAVHRVLARALHDRTLPSGGADLHDALGRLLANDPRSQAGRGGLPR